jgi:hypothetical protein
MRRHLSLEILWVPYLFDEIRKALGDESLEIEYILVHCIIEKNDLIPKLGHSAQRLDYYVHIIIHFNVVQADKPRLVINPIKRS